ncbi:MAG: helix-turn-helix transcriptional regulator [Tidjanibacter sp.]|nr:helix-turn-helix transcriptional regulator [Tidjanibacter sp.]MBR7102111.1 helix-turn-helix transcriptional regulator [Tidjanibacter sp.]
MRKKDEANALIEICPVRNVIARFGNKWGLLVLLIISEERTIRFNSLSKAIPDISPKVLSTTLKTLETDGFVHREQFAEIPPRVEYSLTEMGQSVIPIIKTLTAWAEEHKAQIIENRNN